MPRAKTLLGAVRSRNLHAVDGLGWHEVVRSGHVLDPTVNYKMYMTPARATPTVP